MDLREKKTRRSIRNAFYALRAQKPLERITVRELAQQAEISKSAFYLHYQDLYDLSFQLQNEVIQSILDSIIQPGQSLLDTAQLTHALFTAFQMNQDRMDLLFSGSQASVLPQRLEQGIKEHVFRSDPDKRSDRTLDILLSYQIYGSYYAYWQNRKKAEDAELLEILEQISSAAQSVCRPEEVR